MTFSEKKREQMKIYIAGRDAAILKHYGPGAVTMAICQMCGATAFVSAHHEAEADSITFTPMKTVEECGRCAEVAARAPEIYKWMVGCETFRRVMTYADLLEQEQEAQNALRQEEEHSMNLRPVDGHGNYQIIGCVCGFIPIVGEFCEELTRHIAQKKEEAKRK